MQGLCNPYGGTLAQRLIRSHATEGDVGRPRNGRLVGEQNHTASQGDRLSPPCCQPVRRYRTSSGK